MPAAEKGEDSPPRVAEDRGEKSRVQGSGFSRSSRTPNPNFLRITVTCSSIPSSREASAPVAVIVTRREAASKRALDTDHVTSGQPPAQNRCQLDRLRLAPATTLDPHGDRCSHPSSVASRFRPPDRTTTRGAPGSRRQTSPAAVTGIPSRVDGTSPVATKHSS